MEEDAPTSRATILPPGTKAMALRNELTKIEFALRKQHGIRMADGLCTQTSSHCDCWMAQLVRQAEEAAALPPTR